MSLQSPLGEKSKIYEAGIKFRRESTLCSDGCQRRNIVLLVHYNSMPPQLLRDRWDIRQLIKDPFQFARMNKPWKMYRNRNNAFVRNFPAFVRLLTVYFLIFPTFYITFFCSHLPHTHTSTYIHDYVLIKLKK